ncbi:MAG: GTPase ObgE [Bifidobacteriaceae bacterium]|jgi:GTP-binding protein|nr:GTPase ObgE [Bifidobacteriaceae bacterium]
MTTFIDRAELHIKGGDGGKGCVAVRREKYKPLAGPDGGNGGNGGSIVFVATNKITTLLDYKYNKHQIASNGQVGLGSKKDGAGANDKILLVPVGTVIKEKNIVLADLSFEGASFVAAKGGQGGLGNRALANKKMISPKFALQGTKGQSKDIILELKVLADVGLVGFPSAGKSSIISVMTQSKPKIADYPFTTLVPNLGVANSQGIKFTLADVPGLIPGASSGKGMGLDFLRHIERVSIIAHIVDLAAFEDNRNPMDDIKAIEQELSLYGQYFQENPLSAKERIIVLNKADVVLSEALASNDPKYNLNKIFQDLNLEELKNFGWPIFLVSAVTHFGLNDLKYYLADEIENIRKNLAQKTKSQLKVINISNKQKSVFVKKIITKTGYYWQISGTMPELWVEQIDWNNQDAVRFFSKSLERIGVEKKLQEKGVKIGDEVRVGRADTPYIFNWTDEYS